MTVNISGHTIHTFMGKKFLILVIFVLTSINSLSAQNQSQILIPNDSVNSGNCVLVPIVLYDAYSICAFQFSLILPDGIVPTANTDQSSPVKGGELLTDHNISYHFDNGVLYVACLSITNSLLSANQGIICYVSLQTDSVITDTPKSILIDNIKLVMSNVTEIALEPTECVLTVVAPKDIPQINPVFSFNITPQIINEAFESTIAINSNIDISTIAFNITIPEKLAASNMINILSNLLESEFHTVINQTDECTYNVNISSLDNYVIPAGVTQIADVVINYVLGQILPDIYTFSLCNISITATNGKVYNPAPIEYNLDLTFTGIEKSLSSLDGESTTYYTITGCQVESPVQGITLVRHPDGRVTKIINR